MTTLLALQGVSGHALAQHKLSLGGNLSNATLLREKAFEIIDTVPSGFKAYDDSPLSDRVPLVLVHGIGGTATRLFHWEHFLAYAEKSPEFNQKYKIYLYHYDSTKSVPDISKDLQETLTGFVGAQGGRKIKILAYSEGGLLVRNALQNDYLDENTTEVLTIATPFHGSPLANPEWLQQQVRDEPLLNPVRVARKLVYAITGRKYPTFQQDFHWDNFDHAIPMEQYVKHNGPMVKHDYALARKTNFTTYGSYFGTEVDSAPMVAALDLRMAPPRDELKFSNLFKKNFLFSLIRNNIGKMPLAHSMGHSGKKVVMAVKGRVAEEQPPLPSEEPATPPEPSIAMPLDDIFSTAVTERISPVDTLNSQLTHQTADLPQSRSVWNDLSTAQRRSLERKKAALGAEPVSMMMYNDGISPISSTLWLGRFTPQFNGVQQPVERLWATLKSLKGNRNTRLFAGLDHRNWMDGETRNGQEKLQDLLNPDQPPRSVFEWILYDLMT